MQRLFIFLFVLGGSIWLGATFGKAIVGFDMFVAGTLQLKAQPDLIRIHTIRLFAMLGSITSWAFSITCIGGIGAMVALMRQFRTRGWLLMCSILFVAIIPIQVWIGLEDYKLYTLFDPSSGMALASTADIITSFLSRFNNTALTMATWMSALAALTIVFFASIRPLHKA